jgi:hypothetical protein
MTNAEYRESRGTNRPFTATAEQIQAVWNESIRKEKWKSTRTPPSPKPPAS